MKFQRNYVLSYYKNNLTALKTQRQTDREREMREQWHSLEDNNLCKTISPRGFIIYIALTEALNSVREINF